MIDMHGRFTLAPWSRSRALEELESAWLEEPIPPETPPRCGECATHLPIVTGERAHTLGDCRELVEGGCVDILQADLTHFGGLLPM